MTKTTTALIKVDEQFFDKLLKSRNLSMYRSYNLSEAINNYHTQGTRVSRYNIMGLRKGKKRRISLNALNAFIKFVFQDLNLDLSEALRLKKINPSNIEFKELGSDYKFISRSLPKYGFDIVIEEDPDDTEDDFKKKNKSNKVEFNEAQLKIITNQYIKHFNDILKEDDLKFELEKIFVDRGVNGQIKEVLASIMERDEAKLMVIEGKSGLGKSFELFYLFKTLKAKCHKSIFMYKDFDDDKLKYMIQLKTPKKKLLFIDSFDILLLDEDHYTDYILKINELIKHGIFVIATTRDGNVFDERDIPNIKFPLLEYTDSQFETALYNFSLYYDNVDINSIIELDKANKNILRYPLLLKLFLELNSKNKKELKNFNLKILYDVYWKEKVLNIDEDFEPIIFENWLITITKKMNEKKSRFFSSVELDVYNISKATISKFIKHSLFRGFINKIEKNKYMFFHDTFFQYILSKKLSK